jgi:hypothetical protein
MNSLLNLYLGRNKLRIQAKEQIFMGYLFKELAGVDKVRVFKNHDRDSCLLMRLTSILNLK